VAEAPRAVASVPDDPVPTGVDNPQHEQPAGTAPFGPEVFHERRARLMAAMKTGAAVVFSAQHVDWESDARQDSDFFYLTGLADESGAAIVLAPQDEIKEWLFLRALNVEPDRWTGYRTMLPSRELEQRVGIAHVRRMNSFGGIFASMAYRWHDLHFFGPFTAYDAETPRALEVIGKTSAHVPGSHLKDSIGMVWRMRMQKEPRELELITRATDITVAGHLEGMRRVRPGMHEYELKQIIEDTFRKGGARRLAYGSIVGAGPDGCVLHYPNDDRVIGDGELVLVDAGAEYDHYATDVTRTFPANGKFTPEQRKIYEVVLRAQKAALAKVRPGAKFQEIEDAAQKVIADAGYYDYFIHGVGHHVGIDVHDGGYYSFMEVPLAENAVITVEPGIYMPGKHIGVRIEDTVLVTKDGPKLLSGKLPREPDEIEKVMTR
jgi:Xaa-Pro aminopeptidase